MTDLLDGISEKTTKAVLLDRLRQAARKLAGFEDEKVGRLQEIEERVRAKYAGRDNNLKQIMVSSSVEEWKEAVDFLDNFDDLLPPALARMNEGAKVLLTAGESDGENG